MILTEKDVREYQENMRISISDNLMKELLDKYGTTAIDDERHTIEL